MGWFQRLNEGLGKTRHAVRQSLDRFLGRTPDPALLEELEAALLSADLGARVVDRLMLQVTERARGVDAATSHGIQNVLSRTLYDVLKPVSGPSLEQLIDQAPKPFVILAVGVNGVGKTTTIAKVAQRLAQSGRQPLLRRRSISCKCGRIESGPKSFVSVTGPIRRRLRSTALRQRRRERRTWYSSIRPAGCIPSRILWMNCAR